jgi:hypothetical protein
MTIKEMLRVAKQTAEENNFDVTITLHYGRDKRVDRGVRLSGCFPEEAKELGALIEGKFGGYAKCNVDPGFACVWI